MGDNGEVFPNATKMFNGMVKEALNGKALE